MSLCPHGVPQPNTLFVDLAVCYAVCAVYTVSFCLCTVWYFFLYLWYVVYLDGCVAYPSFLYSKHVCLTVYVVHSISLLCRVPIFLS